MYSRERSRLEPWLLLPDADLYADFRALLLRGGTELGMPVLFCDLDDMLRGVFVREAADRRPLLCATIHPTVAPGVEFFHKIIYFRLETTKNI